MSRWVVRSLLLVLLLTSVAFRETFRSDAEVGVDIEEAVRQMLTHHGMSYRQTKNISDGLLEAMIFDVPSCGEPIQVIPTFRMLGTSALFDRVGRSGDARFFAFLSLFSEQYDRFRFTMEHVKYHFLDLFGVTPYQLDAKMLIIIAPRNCADVAILDWSLVWKTDYRRSIARERNASRQ
jgi:hypothetical protein